MDDDLLAELQAIEAGDLTDPDRIRQTFAAANESLRMKLAPLCEQHDVLDRAKAAFLEGWPNRGLRVAN